MLVYTKYILTSGFGYKYVQVIILSCEGHVHWLPKYIYINNCTYRYRNRYPEGGWKPVEDRGEGWNRPLTLAVTDLQGSRGYAIFHQLKPLSEASRVGYHLGHTGQGRRVPGSRISPIRTVGLEAPSIRKCVSISRD